MDSESTPGSHSVPLSVFHDLAHSVKILKYVPQAERKQAAHMQVGHHSEVKSVHGIL